MGLSETKLGKQLHSVKHVRTEHVPLTLIELLRVSYNAYAVKETDLTTSLITAVMTLNQERMLSNSMSLDLDKKIRKNTD